MANDNPLVLGVYKHDGSTTRSMPIVELLEHLKDQILIEEIHQQVKNEDGSYSTQLVGRMGISFYPVDGEEVPVSNGNSAPKAKKKAKAKAKKKKAPAGPKRKVTVKSAKS